MFTWTPLSFQVSQERTSFVTWSMLLSRPAPCTPTLPFLGGEGKEGKCVMHHNAQGAVCGTPARLAVGPSRPLESLPTPTLLEELLESCFGRVDDTCTTRLQRQYRSLLEKSHIANMKRRLIPSTSAVNVEYEYHRASTTLYKAQERIVGSLGASTEKESMLSRAGLWPRVSPRDILNKLALSQRSLLSESWKAVFVEYAERITMVQRAIRISRLTKREYRPEIERELSNPGRVGWDGMSHPDWLLVELESNILIRQVQAEIASEMLAPSSERNEVVQLNMGEGKSSVRKSLIRLTAADLADRSSSPLSLRHLQIDYKLFVSWYLSPSPGRCSTFSAVLSAV